jgi:hypothetical protein
MFWLHRELDELGAAAELLIQGRVILFHTVYLDHDLFRAFHCPPPGFWLLFLSLPTCWLCFSLLFGNSFFYVSFRNNQLLTIRMFMRSLFKFPARTGVSHGLPHICFTFSLMVFIQDAARSLLKFKLPGINVLGRKFLYRIDVHYNCCPSVSSLFSAYTYTLLAIIIDAEFLILCFV